MDKDADIEAAPPQSWLDALDEGEADIRAGRVTPWPEARAQLYALLESLKAEAAANAR